MKNCLLLLSLFLFSCQKEMVQKEQKQTFLYSAASLQARESVVSQTASIVMRLMKDTLRIPESRLDIIEFMVSDTFSTAVTAMDVVKIVDFSDNLAIRDSTSSFLYSKQYRAYPHNPLNFDEIKLKVWNLSLDNYYFKFTAGNFPANIHVFLYSYRSNRFTEIPTDRSVFYIPFEASTLQSHNYSLMIKRF